MLKQKRKETAAEKCINEFINHVCDGNLAQANASLDNAISEKVKARIRTNLKGDQINED